nr:MAG TPA: hypothetical protein [Caudoviricetes sp.]
MKTRADIIAALWGYTGSPSNEESLRVIILIYVEKLVGECSDIRSILGQLEALAAAYAAPFSRSFDLQELAQLVGQRNFKELRSLLPPPDTRAVVNVVGKAYQYYKYGNMDRAAYNEVLEEIELRFYRRCGPVDGFPRGARQK